MQIIPAIDLLGDDVVRLHQGQYDQVLFRLALRDVLPTILRTAPPLLHVVDLQGARDGALRLPLVTQLVAEAGPTPVQVSGGLRSVRQARDALDAGASRVIVGTAAWSAPEALDEFVTGVGDALVVALDVKDGEIAVRGWRESSGLRVEEALRRCVEAGVPRLHVTAITRDGTMTGPDLALYEEVCQAGIPVVAAGGVRDDDDVADLADRGCEGAIMGVAYLQKLGLLP